MEKSAEFWKEKVYQLVFFGLLAVSIYFLVQTGSYFKEIVIPLFIAAFLSYLLYIPTKLLSKVLKNKSLAILSILLIFGIVISIIWTYVFPIVADQLEAIFKVLSPEKVKSFMLEIENFLLRHKIPYPESFFQTEDIIYTIFNYGKAIDYKSFGNFAGGFILFSLNFIVSMVVTFLATYYLLHDGDEIWKMIISPLQSKAQDHANEIKTRVDRSVNAYIFGQLQIAILTTTVMLITYLAFNVPYASALAAIQMLEIIPILGTWVAIITGVTITIFIAGPSKAVLIFLVYLAYTQLIRDIILAPKIMGNALGLHPIAVLLAVMIGAKIAGPLGIIFAPPVAASLTEIFNYFVEYHRLKAKIHYYH